MSENFNGQVATLDAVFCKYQVDFFESLARSLNQNCVSAFPFHGDWRTL